MLTLKRLPPSSIVRAHVGGKVFLQKHPAPADSGRRDEPGSGALAECGWMQLQKEGCILEIERAHRCSIVSIESRHHLKPGTR